MMLTSLAMEHKEREMWDTVFDILSEIVNDTRIEVGKEDKECRLRGYEINIHDVLAVLHNQVEQKRCKYLL
jgi:hypothetical protein